MNATRPPWRPGRARYRQAEWKPSPLFLQGVKQARASTWGNSCTATRVTRPERARSRFAEDFLGNPYLDDGDRVKNQRSPEIVVRSQSAAMSDGPFRDKHVGKLTVCTTLGAVTPQHLNQRHKRASDDLQPSSCSCPVWFRLLSLGSDAATGSSCYGLSDAYRRLTAVEDGVGVDEFAGDWQVSGVGGRRLINLNRTGHLRLQYPRWMRTPTRNYSVRTLRQAVRCPSTSG